MFNLYKAQNKILTQYTYQVEQV